MMDIGIPENLRKHIPQLEEASTEPDPLVWMKLSAPEAGWTGYVIAMSHPVRSLWRDDGIVFYGWVVFWDEALKYFTLSDLEHLPGAVVRDETFEPCHLSAVQTCEGGFQPKFSLGQVVATPGALAALAAAGQGPLLFLRRHMHRDWGEVDKDDWQENEFSLVNGFRLLSAYTLKDGTRIWIITEADRSATTILLPSEY